MGSHRQRLYPIARPVLKYSMNSDLSRNDCSGPDARKEETNRGAAVGLRPAADFTRRRASCRAGRAPCSR
jgi:hypothetical protein